MADHLPNLTHKHYEKLKKQITDINVESEDDQIQYIMKRTLEDPTKIHPLGLQQEIFQRSDEKLSHVLPKDKIQNTLSNLRKELFLLVKIYVLKELNLINLISKIIESDLYQMIFFSLLVRR